MQLPKEQKRKVRERLRAYIDNRDAIDLLDKLLTLDPSRRITADPALNHDFFWTEPMPSNLAHMLSQHLTSMYEYTTTSKRRGVHSHILQHQMQQQRQQQQQLHPDQHIERIF